MSMSADMARIVEATAEEFATTEVFNSWMPPDGTYTCLITGYQDGVSKKGGREYAWWRLDARLQVPGDPELDEKEFTLGFYKSYVLGILKGAMSVLAGRKIEDMRQAESILNGAVGWVVNIRKTTRIVPEEKGGGEFPNVNILEVVQKTDDVPNGEVAQE